VVTDAQVRKLMEEMRKDGRLGRAALRAGMHRNTARRYVEAGKLPSELREPRSWRTRDDPFTEDWPGIVERLEAAPELEAKALFERKRPVNRIYRRPQTPVTISGWRSGGDVGPRSRPSRDDTAPSAGEPAVARDVAFGRRVSRRRRRAGSGAAAPRRAA
jgi:hypothetical protein